MKATLAAKYDHLMAILRDAGGVVIGFSGGVDSTLLLKAAVDVLGNRALAVTVTSVLHPAFELDEAEDLARILGARHRRLEADPLALDQVAQNPPDRCYHCKRAIFSQLLALAAEEDLPLVVDGSNVDDQEDYRPGARALVELGVRSPLREAGLSKAEIRELSKGLGLPTWDKPALACLATRVPYGEELTPARLRRIEQAEQTLRALGVRQVRVRDFGQTARIEVATADFPRLLEEAARTHVVARFRELGYDYATLDLAGYRSGSMDKEASKK